MKATLKSAVKTALNRVGVRPHINRQLLWEAAYGTRNAAQRTLVLQGQTLEACRAQSPSLNLASAEFSIFSQFGEDGILAFIIDQLPGIPHTFVEFGVESYTEANTRYLALAHNWRGLVMDGSDDHVARIRRDDISWRHSVDAVAAFITRENINSLLKANAPGKEIGILSTDIDGNDYWVSEAIREVDPWVVVAEYNGVMGRTAKLSVPYKATFRREEEHPSCIHWGCSLGALDHLWSARGYTLLGCNSAGNNAFFVQTKRLAGRLRAQSVVEAFRFPRFREARGAGGALTLKSPLASLREFPESLVLVDVATGKTVSWQAVLSEWGESDPFNQTYTK